MGGCQASPPWRCDQLLQRDFAFRQQRPWLAGVKSEESWKWGQSREFVKGSNQACLVRAKNLDEVKSKVVGDGHCLVGALGEDLRSKSHPLFAKAFSTNKRSFSCLVRSFPTPDAVKRRAAGQGKRIVAGGPRKIETRPAFKL
jgi:hypothetical protein